MIRRLSILFHRNGGRRVCYVLDTIAIEALLLLRTRIQSVSYSICFYGSPGNSLSISHSLFHLAEMLKKGIGYKKYQLSAVIPYVCDYMGGRQYWGQLSM